MLVTDRFTRETKNWASANNNNNAKKEIYSDSFNSSSTNVSDMWGMKKAYDQRFGNSQIESFDGSATLCVEIGKTGYGRN